MCGFADGAVVGSALVRLIAEHGAASELEKAVQEFVSALKSATASQ